MTTPEETAPTPTQPTEPPAPGTTPPAPKVDPELGKPLDGGERTASQDDPVHKHAHKTMTAEEKKKLGGGLPVGRPTIKGPAQDAWDKNQAEVEAQRKEAGGTAAMSAKEIKEKGGGLEVGKPTVEGPALDEWNKKQEEAKKNQ